MNGTALSGELLGINIDSAIIGAVIGVIGSFLVLALRHQLRKRRLRKALRAEIRTMAEDLYRYAETVAGKEPDAIVVPPDPVLRTIFENNASELGMLSGKEVKQLTQFYGLAEAVRQRISTLSSESNPPAYELQVLRRDLIQLNNRKNSVLEALEGKILCAKSSVDENERVYSDVDAPDYDVVDYLEQAIAADESNHQPEQGVNEKEEHEEP